MGLQTAWDDKMWREYCRQQGISSVDCSPIDPLRQDDALEGLRESVDSHEEWRRLNMGLDR